MDEVEWNGSDRILSIRFLSRGLSKLKSFYSSLNIWNCLSLADISISFRILRCSTLFQFVVESVDLEYSFFPLSISRTCESQMVSAQITESFETYHRGGVLKDTFLTNKNSIFGFSVVNYSRRRSDECRQGTSDRKPRTFWQNSMEEKLYRTEKINRFALDSNQVRVIHAL